MWATQSVIQVVVESVELHRDIHQNPQIRHIHSSSSCSLLQATSNFRCYLSPFLWWLILLLTIWKHENRPCAFPLQVNYKKAEIIV